MSYENNSLTELKQGYMLDEQVEIYKCVFCETITEKGRIYGEDGEWFDAERQMKEHIKKLHGSPFQALMDLDKRHNGLTDNQKNVLHSLYSGNSDKEIAREQGIGSPSTVRQHRFKLKEKAKQAKLFLALMDLLEETKTDEMFTTIHKGATMVDDRWAVTDEEEEKIINTYVDKISGRVKQFPSKEKRKIVLLKYMLTSFEVGEKYSEKEVNEEIKKFYDDFVSIRRYFIEYGFLDRARDGSSYWVNR